ncbi:MAG: 30S ribosomal protein S2 [Patescibacteria group bacterium]|nr:30S ribosomal protein S2 [Patescibacteria group bacterium]MBU1877090.1 30S ribosomal protein S2 [Patescibacteria group bacterium]
MITKKIINQSDEPVVEEVKLNPQFGEMIAAGLHFGSSISRINPKMKQYLTCVRNGVHIIDVEKTAEKLQEALTQIQKLISEKKVILLVGTSVQAKELVKNTAIECGLPYINSRWLGGTISNFEVIKKRIQHFKDLEEKKKTGELDKYTKNEKAKFDKELTILGNRFSGIRNLSKLPDAVIVVNTKTNHLAVKEARPKNIKIFAIVDTDSDPSVIDYPIPANDDAISSIKYILDKIKEVILNTKPIEKEVLATENQEEKKA